MFVFVLVDEKKKRIACGRELACFVLVVDELKMTAVSVGRWALAFFLFILGGEKNGLQTVESWCALACLFVVSVTAKKLQ